MTPIDSAEISALIDGELTPERAQEVRRAIASDPALGGLHAQLTAVDADLKMHAAAAVFHPRVSLPLQSGYLGHYLLLGATLLLILRVVVKIAPVALAIGLQIPVLVLIIVWLVLRLGRVSQDESERLRPVGHGAVEGAPPV